MRTGTLGPVQAILDFIGSSSLGLRKNRTILKIHKFSNLRNFLIEKSIPKKFSIATEPVLTSRCAALNFQLTYKTRKSQAYKRFPVQQAEALLSRSFIGKALKAQCTLNERRSFSDGHYPLKNN